LPYYGLFWGRFHNVFSYLLDRVTLKGAIIKVQNTLLSGNYNLLLVKNTPQVNLILSKISIPQPVKLVTEVNEAPDYLIKAEKEFNLYKNNVIPKLDGIWSMTHGLLEVYSKLGLRKDCQKKLLPMSVDLSRFKVRPSDRFPFPYLFYCGTLNDGKDGVDILVKSFALIHHDYPRLKLVLTGWYFEKMLKKQKAIIQEYEIKDKVIYTGEINREQIPSLMKAAKVLCLARPKSEQAQYGFPTKLGEYLAAKRPVCVTAVGEIPLYLQDKYSAAVVVPDDAEAFAKGLRFLLREEEKAEMIAANGYEVAKRNFSTEALSLHMKNYLNELKIENE
jgi:glycosyltransferase involved in cell wall biosynthesis